MRHDLTAAADDAQTLLYAAEVQERVASADLVAELHQVVARDFVDVHVHDYFGTLLGRHHESKSRGLENTIEKQARFLREQQIMHERWKTDKLPDPYYNVNLTRDAENYEIGV